MEYFRVVREKSTLCSHDAISSVIMRLVDIATLSLLALASACGGQASSGPPPMTSASSETAPATSEPAPAVSTGDAVEAEGSSGPPQCVPIGRSCETNAYCCYGSCRAEDGSPELLCRP